MEKQLIARGQVTITTQTDVYTINQSINDYVFAAANNGTITSAATFTSTVKVTQNDINITDFTIGTITKPAGFATIAVNNTNKTIVYTVSANTTNLADQGIILIPIIIKNQTYYINLSWSKAKGGTAGQPGKDSYTISSTRNSFVISTDKQGSIHTAVTTTTVISALKGETAITPVIGTLPTVAGCTITKSGTTVTFVFGIGSSLAENGVIDIPVTVDGKNFSVSFSYAKARTGVDGVTGAAGKDANLLDWVKDWNTNKTVIGSDSVITPKIYAGVKNSNGTLTGVAIGKFPLSVVQANGSIATETVNGIYGFKDGYKTFFVDSAGNAQLGMGNHFIKYNSATGKVEFGSEVSLNWTTAANNALSSAKTYADTKKTEAVNAAATDATNKSNNAKTDAISAAATDATNKVNAVQVGVRNYILNSSFNVSTITGLLTVDGVTAIIDTATKYLGNNTIKITQTNATGTAANTSRAYFTAKKQLNPASFSMWVMASAATNLRIRIGGDGASAVDIPITTSWKLIKVENKIPTSFVVLFGATTAGVTFNVACPMLVEGTKAADWTPAPEDVATDITTAKNAASSAQTQANTANTVAIAARDRLNNWASDSVISPNEKLSLKQEQKALMDEKTQIVADAAKYSVSSTDYVTAFTNYNSQLTNHSAASPENITIAAAFTTTQTAYYSAKQTVLNAIAAAAKKYAEDKASSAKTDAINAAATDATNKINALQIGGRNLLNNSSEWRTAAWNNGITTNGGGYTVDNTVLYDGKATLKTLVGSGLTHPWLKLENGVEYTYSAIVMCNENITGNGSTPLHFQAGLNNASQSKATVTKFDTTVVANKWKRIYVTFKLNGDADSLRPFFYRGANGTTTYWIAYLKLEKGNLATDWTPSISDTTATIADAKKAGTDAKTVADAITKKAADEKWDTKLTYIDGTGIFTGKLSANTVSAIAINASQITAGTINAARIDVASLKTSLITAGNIEALTLNVVRGKIGGWTIDADSIFRGTKNNTANAYTAGSGSMTIGSNGIRGFKWNLESTGAGTVAGGNIKWDAAGNVTFGANVVLNWTNAANTAATNALNSAKTYADTKKTEAMNAAASDATTKADAAKELAQAMAFGKMLYRDPTFFNGMNSIALYNNSNNGTVTLSRTLDNNAPNDSKQVIIIKNTGTSSPYCAGFTFANATSYRKIFICRIIAKIPIGRSISYHSNSIGTGGTQKWLTPTAGTGEWCEYINKVSCGTASFSSTNYYAITGATGTTEAPVEWRLAYATVFDVTSTEKYTTTIDGNGIYTSTLNANQINAGTISADRIAAGSIKADKLDAATVKASIINTDYINGLTLNFVRGKIGGWTIGADNIQAGTINVVGQTPIQIRSVSSGSGYIYSGQFKPLGITLSWYQNSNAGHLVFGQVMATGNTVRTGFFGLQMMSWDSYEYFTISANTTKSGAKEVYNRIAGWAFDNDTIYLGTKNNSAGAYTAGSGSISIGTNGIRGFKWRLDSTGAGAVAGGNISWDAAGNVTFGASVTLNWTNAANNALSNAKTYADSKVNDLSVGAKNYVRNSGSEYSNLTSVSGGGGHLILSTTLTPSMLLVGDLFMLSFEAKGTVAGNLNTYNTNYNTNYDTHVIAISTSWKRYIIQKKITKIGTTNVNCEFWSPVLNNGIYIRKVKLERGNKATDWSPAPEDTDYLKTYINGSGIYTGSLTASQITAGTIHVDRIAAGSITAAKLNVANVQASVVTAAAVNGLTCAFVRGTIGGFTIEADNLRVGSLGAGGATPIQIRTTSAGPTSGLWYTGAFKPFGITMTWHQSNNAGHIVFGQIAATASSPRSGFIGIQMMSHDSLEYFCLSTNYSKSGAKEVYNRIAGWAFDNTRIWKNSVSLGADGSIQNGTKWQINNDGSGRIANGNIVWDAAGTVTFSAGVALNWQNDATNKANAAKELAQAMAFGKMLFRYPEFFYNGAVHYNSSSNYGGNATRAIVTYSGCPNSTGYVLRYTATDWFSASDNRVGGFYWAHASRANAIFIVRIIALIPAGRYINNYHNAYGSGGTTKWLTSQAGTGKWEEYICKVTCGTSGTFSTINHFALTGGVAPTAAAPVNWYIAFATVYDVFSSEKYNTTIDVNGIYTGIVRANQVLVDSALVVGGSSYNGSISVRDASNSVKVTLDRTGITAVGGTIGGWTIAATQISKNGIVLGADGSITNGARWQLNTNGSGSLANGNISWDTSGNLSMRGKIEATSGTIGGFEISYGRIGSVATGTGSGGGLAIYNDLFRVGSSVSYALLGDDTFPASAGGAFKATARFTNTRYDSYWTNIGLYLDVRSARRNFGIHSNAALLAPFMITNRVKIMSFGSGSYTIDFAQNNIFFFYATTTCNVNLPTESSVCDMFGVSYLPSDFACVITFVYNYNWGNRVTFLNIRNHNGGLQNYAMEKGDSITLLCAKYPSFHYQLINHVT